MAVTSENKKKWWYCYCKSKNFNYHNIIKFKLFDSELKLFLILLCNKFSKNVSLLTNKLKFNYSRRTCLKSNENILLFSSQNILKLEV